MIVKFTETGDLLKATSKLKGFVHISFFEEMRLCRKNVTDDSEMAEYSTLIQPLKSLKIACGSHFRGANHFYASYGFDSLFHVFFQSHATSYKLILRVQDVLKIF